MFERYITDPRHALYRTVLERRIGRSEVREEIDIDFKEDSSFRLDFYSNFLFQLWANPK